jgi:D-glycero-D-manno-heptose 1,7-bisphosphate phosphatase
MSDRLPAGPPARRPAVFLDRDGTLVEDPGYLDDPSRVRLLPGAGEAVAALKQAGYLVIIVTNQSGIARGLITPEQYEAVAARTAELLAQAGGAPDAQYHCPHLPEISGPCGCRKPGLDLYRQAISRFGIDPARSWWVGDRETDLLPASALGGRGIGIGATLAGRHAGGDPAPPFQVERDLAAAARRIVSSG